MIKALRVLDPSDLLLNHVAGPVRRYLKHRKDAVRQPFVLQCTLIISVIISLHTGVLCHR